MRRGAILASALIALTLASCAGRNDYTGALVTTAIAMAGTAAYRATTGGCWGQCLHGLVCDRASGMCVPPPEIPPGSYALPPRYDLEDENPIDAGADATPE
jgi:hypothetical protein